MAPGSFSANATEVYQEGLRLPPVKLFRRGEPVRGRVADPARQSPHARRTHGVTSTPSWARCGSGSAGSRRCTTSTVLSASSPPCPPSSTMRSSGSGETSTGFPNGTYSGEDCQEDDGFDERPLLAARRPHHCGDHIVVDWSRTDQQARGAINAPYPVTASATYSGDLPGDRRRRADQCRGDPADRHRRAAGHRRERPAPWRVRGRSDRAATADRRLIQGRVLSQVVPERCSAASGGTSGNFLFGGIHPPTGAVLHALPLRG